MRLQDITDLIYREFQNRSAYADKKLFVDEMKVTLQNLTLDLSLEEKWK
jgi:hypothetical protein